MDVIRVKEGRLDIGKSIIKKTMELILDGNSEHVAGKNIRFVIALDLIKCLNKSNIRDYVCLYN